MEGGREGGREGRAGGAGRKGESHRQGGWGAGIALGVVSTPPFHPHPTAIPPPDLHLLVLVLVPGSDPSNTPHPCKSDPPPPRPGLPTLPIYTSLIL